MKRHKILLTSVFLLVELVAYYLILTTGGKVLVYSSFGAIVLCFLYALLHIQKGSVLMVVGLAGTVAADYCLVICSPIEQLWGMVFFLAVQTLYAAQLFRMRGDKVFLWLRGALTLVAVIITIIVLRDRADALAIISMCYYANLIMNIVAAFGVWKKNILLPIGLVLFIVCDTVIGLQVASTGYLPIKEGSWLYALLFSGFNLSWFFYLPSQVLIALSTVFTGRRKE